MARYSRVALYNKAKNATHNHPNLIPTHYQKDIVQIPEAKNEPVDFLNKQEDKKEKLLKPVAENVAAVEKEAKTPSKVKRSVKRSASAKPEKNVVAKKVVAKKNKKASTVAKKSVQKASPVKAEKAPAKSKAKKSMVSKKPVKKSAKKTSSKAVSSKNMSMKKPVKKMAGSNKKNTKPVLKRQTKKSK